MRCSAQRRRYLVGSCLAAIGSAQRTVRQDRAETAVARRVTFSLMEGLKAEDDEDPRLLRVSDRERDHAVGRLKDAVSEGLIDVDEFGERTSKALVARTRVSWTT